MTTVNFSEKTNNSTPPTDRPPAAPSWGTTFLTATWNRASKAYSFSKKAVSLIASSTPKTTSFVKDQITYLTNTFNPKELLVFTKDAVVGISKELINTSTKTKVAAVSLVALGYTYSQAPSFEETMKRLIDSAIEQHPSFKSPDCDSTYQITASVAISSFVSTMVSRHLQTPINERTTLNYHLLTAKIQGLAEQVNAFNPFIIELQNGFTFLSERLVLGTTAPPFTPILPRGFLTPNDSMLAPPPSYG